MSKLFCSGSLSSVDERADLSNQFGFNFPSHTFQSYSTRFSISKCWFTQFDPPHKTKLALNIFIYNNNCSCVAKSLVSTNFFFPFVANSIAYLLPPGDFSFVGMLWTTCRIKSITSAMIAPFEDKEDINFVVDGWDNNFLRLCIFEWRWKGLVKSGPVRAWKMEELRILLHLTHLQEQKYCDKWYQFWLKMSLCKSTIISCTILYYTILYYTILYYTIHKRI